MRGFRVGIDSYGLHPLGFDPVQMLQWAGRHGAQGVQFSGFEENHRTLLHKSYLRDLAACAREDGLYLEWGGAQHIPRDTTTWARKELLEINRAAARQAAALGTRIVRSCSGGLMRWRPESPMTETLLQETACALRSQRAMLQDHQVILALETHFEFTSYELVRQLERCEAEPGTWLGICLDTMNLLTMMEDPVAATRRLLPWVVCTHMKDGGIALTSDGLQSFPVAMGKGVIDVPGILRLLQSLSAEVTLSVESHGGSFDLPVFDPLFMSKFPDLTPGEFARLIELSRRSQERASSGCRVTEREHWPRICQRRTAADLRALRRLASAEADS